MATKAKKTPKRVTDDPLYEQKVIELAKMLHESGREAIATGKTLNSIHNEAGKPVPFVEWAALPMAAVEGRMLQAKFLLDGRRKPRLKEIFS